MLLLPGHGRNAQVIKFCLDLVLIGDCKGKRQIFYLDRQVDFRLLCWRIIALQVSLVLLHHVPASLDISEHALQLAGILIAAFCLELNQNCTFSIV